MTACLSSRHTSDGCLVISAKASPQCGRYDGMHARTRCSRTCVVANPANLLMRLTDRPILSLSRRSTLVIATSTK